MEYNPSTKLYFKTEGHEPKSELKFDSSTKSYSKTEGNVPKSELKFDPSSNTEDESKEMSNDLVHVQYKDSTKLLIDLNRHIESNNKKSLKSVAFSVAKQFENCLYAKHKYLLHSAWLGYKPETSSKLIQLKNIQLVALVNRHIGKPPIERFMNIPIYWREKNDVSKEAEETIYLENMDKNVKNKIPGYTAKTVFDMHSNLTIVHPSSFKSIRFKTDKHIVVKQPCIALYCRFKGIIPLGEEQFPKTLLGFETDVREGYCIFGTSNLVRPGTKIQCTSSNKQGTVGGFVKLDNGKSAFLTAAHVVANCTQLSSPEATKNTLFKSGTISVSRGVMPHEELGKVINGCFSYENTNETSVDVAVVEIDEGMKSTDGNFPETKDDLLTSTGISYCIFWSYIDIMQLNFILLLS